MIIAGGYVDDKIVLARKMLAEGRPMQEIAQAIGYKDASSCRRYMARMGCALPSIKPRHYPSHTDEQRRHLSNKMKEWWAQQGRGKL